jgi:protein-L-isoaspartate(D-aspartate) O-methyltransferase
MSRRATFLLLCVSALAAAACPKREAPGDRSGIADSRGPVNPAPESTAFTEATAPADERRAERESMVREQLEKRGISEADVLAAMRKVPRHLFVPEATRDEAYADRPLPIGNGQTISQPYIVAFMTRSAAIQPKDKRSAAIQPKDKCLEIGTGSGYQAAVLAELCEKTYSIEYLPEVAKLGAGHLRAAGYGPERVELRVGDGYQGWPEAAPFDVIIVTAAPDHVPRPLLEQLSAGGRLIIPVGPGGDQELELWTRIAPGMQDAAFQRKRLIGVRFVPFLGDKAQRKN